MIGMIRQTDFFNAFIKSVFSQEKPPSFIGARPKCPYDAVLAYIGFRRLKCLIIPTGVKSIASDTAFSIFSSDTWPVP